MGAIDPISKISNICNKHNIWLHIDGAYSGTVIFSEEYKKLINGIEKSDSFCFNAHKTLGTPISTSIFVVRDQNDLMASFSNDAKYRSAQCLSEALIKFFISLDLYVFK